MIRRRYADGEYIELVWDGLPVEHFVAGHVSADEFRAELQRWFAFNDDVVRRPVMPADAAVEHGYARVVRGEDDEFGHRTTVWQWQREPWDGHGHQRRVTRGIEARGVGVWAARRDVPQAGSASPTPAPHTTEPNP